MMWINEEKRSRFDGILLVDNHQKEKDRDAVNLAVADAHAAGMAVFYVFDDAESAKLPGEEIEWIEEMDFMRVLGDRDLRTFAIDLLKELRPRYEDVIAFSGGKKFKIDVS